ncbi:MAG TPA: hypothetical protein VFU67_00485 [Nitrososphaeraceae archaeon]|nr:hypothetical protein [Nitrososphaeraceae archaeon]
MRATIQCVLIIGIVFLFILAYSANQLLFSQNSSELSLSPIPSETIKIVNPITTQNVSTGQELIITGVSSDNTLKNCAVSVIVNDVRPYQTAFPKGTDGINDYSQWEFILRTNYTQIIEGENKITSKLQCTSAPPRWYSVLVNGVPNYSNEDMLSPVPTEEQEQNIPATNLSETSDIDGTQTEEQEQNIPATNLSETSDDNNNVLLVSIFPLKNPVARGDSQNTTITVTDSASRPVANAEIDGNLIYPGDNYEKEFSGITDPQGKFVYSWIIGEDGDVGPLSIEVEVASQGYPSASATSSFEVVESSGASGINNDLDDPFD